MCRWKPIHNSPNQFPLVPVQIRRGRLSEVFVLPVLSRILFCFPLPRQGQYHFGNIPMHVVSVGKIHNGCVKRKGSTRWLMISIKWWPKWSIRKRDESGLPPFTRSIQWMCCVFGYETCFLIKEKEDPFMSLVCLFRHHAPAAAEVTSWRTECVTLAKNTNRNNTSTDLLFNRPSTNI